MQDIQISNIPVSAIDRTDTGFRICRVDDDQTSALAASMAVIGMSVPVLLCAFDDNKAYDDDKAYTVVSGFKRLGAAVSLGWDTIPARVMTGRSQRDIARLAVAENAFQRELGPGEQVRAVGLLARFMDAGQISQDSRAVFNTRLNAGYINSLVLINALPKPALSLLDNGFLSIKAAKTLTHGPHLEEAGSFINLFATVKLSSSKQMEIITWVREICTREKISVPVLCRDIALPSEDEISHKDLAAAGNRLRTRLYHRRYPALDLAKKEATAHVHAMKLPKGIRITLPENFESMVYSVSLAFTSPEEFDHRIDALGKLSGTEKLKALLKR